MRRACAGHTFNPQTLAEAVKAAGPVPEHIAIVVPAGVFTTPIEWVAITVAAGAAYT